MQFAAIVVAAGRGTRFGRPKQLVPIGGRPMVAWAVHVFAAMPEISETIVVTEPEWLDEVAQAVAPHRVVAGGASRQESVHRGLLAVRFREGGVLIHDGARPLVTAADVRRALKVVGEGTGSVLATPVVDTIKVADATTKTVRQTLDRATLWAAQTPQCAMYADMLAAHEAGIREGIDATDDAMLLERAGYTVQIVPGSAENFKVTLPEDLARAQAIAAERS